LEDEIKLMLKTLNKLKEVFKITYKIIKNIPYTIK